MKVCTKCFIEKPAEEFFSRTGNRVNKKHSECKDCFRDRARQRAAEGLIYIKTLKGGECKLCGYSRCISALEFHHKDPAKKEVGLAKMATYSRERIALESEKCVLLCSNCHREVHAGLHNGIEALK